MCGDIYQSWLPNGASASVISPVAVLNVLDSGLYLKENGSCHRRLETGSRPLTHLNSNGGRGRLQGQRVCKTNARPASIVRDAAASAYPSIAYATLSSRH